MRTVLARVGLTGALEIRAVDGQLTYVRLYGWAGDVEGFSVGHDYPTSLRNCYRGGNLNEFDSILRRATAEARKTALASGQ